MSSTDTLKKNAVIPDVIDDVNWTANLQVSFPKGEVKDGNEFKPSDVQSPPTVTWNADSKKLYSLIMTDPDAPSRIDPKFREFRHWVVMNIPGSDVSKGEVVTPYMGSAPPKGTGLHRYIFCLFAQPERVQAPKLNNEGKNRGGWKVRKFAQDFHLGSPVAVQFFQAANQN